MGRIVVHWVKRGVIVGNTVYKRGNIAVLRKNMYCRLVFDNFLCFVASLVLVKFTLF